MPQALSRPVQLSAAAVALGTLIATVGLAVAASPAHADTFTVTTTADVLDAPGTCSGLTAADPGPDGAWSLREAVCLANLGTGYDEIILPAGNYPLDSPLEISSQLGISGAGIGVTTIDASATDRAIDAWFGGLSLASLTVIGGDARSSGLADGGAIFTFVPTFLNEVRITGGLADNGGGIWAGSSLILLQSVIEGNTAASEGGGVYAVAELNIQLTTISGNAAATGGGLALHSGGSDVSTIEQSTISGNTATDRGGGILVSPFHHGQTVVTDTTIADNTAGVDGGGVMVAILGAGEIFLSSTTVTGNSSAGVGGISWEGGFATVQHSIVAENGGGDLGGTIGGPGNIVGVAGGSVVDGIDDNRAGTSAAPLDPQLRELGLYGGLTETRVPLPGSPAIDTGISCGAVDQRMVVRDASCDVGAVELTAAPDTAITSGPAAVVASGSASLTASATGGSPAYSFECDLGNTGAFVPCAATATTSGLIEGAHVFGMRAFDAFGATDATPALHHWTVDLTAPALAWGVVTLGTEPDSTSTLAFTASDANGVASIECSLDGAAFAPCTSPVTTPALAVGAHSLRLRATDTAGNTSPALQRDWTVVAATVPAADDDTAVDDTGELADTGIQGFDSSLVLAVMLLAGGALLVVVRMRTRRA